MEKNNSFLLLVFINAIALTGHSQKVINKTPLEITGTALLNGEHTKDYAVSVYLDGTKIDSMFTKSKKNINFYVNYNQVYTFLFQKESFKDKIIIVNTSIPDGLIGMQDDTFEFDVEMSQALIKNSSDIEDYPVAILNISKAEESLEASKSYNKFTHQE